MTGKNRSDSGQVIGCRVLLSVLLFNRITACAVNIDNLVDAEKPQYCILHEIRVSCIMQDDNRKDVHAVQKHYTLMFYLASYTAMCKRFCEPQITTNHSGNNFEEFVGKLAIFTLTRC